MENVVAATEHLVELVEGDLGGMTAPDKAAVVTSHVDVDSLPNARLGRNDTYQFVARVGHDGNNRTNRHGPGKAGVGRVDEEAEFVS